MKYEYPSCRKEEKTEDYFGIKLEAPYTWLRDTNAPEVLDFTARENAFTDAWFEGKGVEEVKSRLKAAYVPDPVSGISPWKDGFLATRNLEGNYSVVELDKNLQIVRTLFKRNDLPKRTPFSAEACPSDENLLAVLSQVDAAPRPDYVIYDWEKQEVLQVLPMTFGGVWSKNKKIFYFATTAAEKGQSVTAIKYWSAGTNEVKDLLVFSGYSIFGHVGRSEDGACYMLAFSQNYSELVFYAYYEESGKIEAINEGNPQEMTYIDTVGGKHYFISLKESDHGIVLAVPEGKTLEEAEVVYRETSGYMDSGFSAGGRLFVHIQSCAASSVRMLPGGEKISLPSETGALSPNGKGKGVLYFQFDTFTEKPQILSFDGKEFRRTGEDADGVSEEADELVVELLFAKSVGDGARIPYYLVRRKDAEKNGEQPVLMYGYGGYNISMPPWSKEMVTGTDIPDWVKGGGLYVHCLLRGGNEYGPAWHEAGMGLRKKNCYYDFIGIAEQIIADGWTKPSRIAITGCSNGGLLMSTLVTMRPDLWGCVIDSVPHTDMIHFAEDDRGSMYITEYGNPHGSREEFTYLLSYSPVHNVKETEYPPVYIQTGECDNNVPPYHGKSFAAMMQSKNTSDHPILLCVLKEGSHDRGQGEVYWNTVSEMRVFINQALGL